MKFFLVTYRDQEFYCMAEHKQLAIIMACDILKVKESGVWCHTKRYKLNSVHQKHVESISNGRRGYLDGSEYDFMWEHNITSLPFKQYVTRQEKIDGLL